MLLFRFILTTLDIFITANRKYFSFRVVSTLFLCKIIIITMIITIIIMIPDVRVKAAH